MLMALYTTMAAIDPDQLGEESQQSIEKLRDLVEDMRSVQDHEHSLLNDVSEPPSPAADAACAGS